MITSDRVTLSLAEKPAGVYGAIGEDMREKIGSIVAKAIPLAGEVLQSMGIKDMQIKGSNPPTIEFSTSELNRLLQPEKSFVATVASAREAVLRERS